MISETQYRSIIEDVVDLRDKLEKLLPPIGSPEDDSPKQSALVSAEYYVRLRSLHDEVDALKKLLYKAMDDYETVVVPAVFEVEGATSVNLAIGYRVTISEVIRASIPAETKGAAYNWLQENNLGDLITSTVNASSLSATARALLVEGKELPAPLFKTAILPQVSMTKLKKTLLRTQGN